MQEDNSGLINFHQIYIQQTGGVYLAGADYSNNPQIPTNSYVSSCGNFMISECFDKDMGEYKIHPYTNDVKYGHIPTFYGTFEECENYYNSVKL